MARRRMWLALLLALAALAGCSLERERSFKLSDDWSRGVRVGTASVRQPVGLAVDQAGAYLLWTVREGESTRLNYARLAPDGTPVLNQVLPSATVFPRLPQLVAHDDLHAFVLTRFSLGEPDGVYHIRLNRDGVVQGDPLRLSGPAQKSSIFAVAPAADQSIHLVWDVVEGPDLGVYYQRLQGDGTAGGPARLIGPGGEQPAAQVDDDGVLHVAWLTPSASGVYDLSYASMAGGDGAGPTVVAQPRIALTDIMLPPALAVHDGIVHILWSQEHRSGMQQGSTEMFLVAFPAAAPSLSAPQTIHVPKDPARPAAASQEFPPLTEVVWADANQEWSDFLEGPSAVQGSGQPAAQVLADVNFEFRFDPRPQIVLLLLRDGELAAYDQPARTRQYSQRPRGVAAGGHLHIAWIDLEQPGAYSVYYASTSPAVQAALNRRTANDTAIDAIDLVWGMASGLTFVPLVGILLVPVALAMVIFYLSGADDSLKRGWAARLTFLVTGVIYLGGKWLVLAALITRPPLMAAVPQQIQPLWMLLVFLLVAGLAALITWLYVRRKDNPELFKAMLLFVLSDAALTLLVYGPTFYAE